MNLSENNNSNLLLDEFPEFEVKDTELTENYLHPEFIENLEKETSLITNSLNNKLKYLEYKSINIIKNTNTQKNLFSLLSSNSLDSIERVDNERDNLRLIEDEFNLLLKKKKMDKNTEIEYKKDLKKRKKILILKLHNLETKHNELLDNMDIIKKHIYSNIFDKSMDDKITEENISKIIEEVDSKIDTDINHETASTTHYFMSGGKHFFKKIKITEKKKNNKKFKKSKKNNKIQYGGSLDIIADKIIDLNKYLEDNKNIIEKEDLWTNNDSIIIKLKKVNNKLKINSNNLGVQQNILNLYNKELIKQINKEKEFTKKILENKKLLIDKINEEEKISDKILSKLNYEIVELDKDLEKYKDLNIKILLKKFIKFYYSMFYLYFYILGFNIIKNANPGLPIDNIKNIINDHNDTNNTQAIKDNFYNEIYNKNIFIFLEKILEIQTLLQNIVSNNILIECILKAFCYFLILDKNYNELYSQNPVQKKEIKDKLNIIIKNYFNLHEKKQFFLSKMFPFIFSD